MAYTLTFTAANVNFLDPQPADADTPIALFSGASFTGSDGTIVKMNITGLGASDSLTLSGAPAGFSFSHSGTTWTLNVPAGATTTDMTNALNAIRVTSTNDPTSSAGVVESVTIKAVDVNGRTIKINNNNTNSTSLTIHCFYPGTMIRTPDGEAAIETFKPGDLVLTSEGAARKINWLGRRTISTVFADPMRAKPIRIKAGALAENVPARDLLVSPDHAMFVDGVLIHASALVNGTSIVRETRVPRVFTYFHIELDDHSLILAENAPAETFVDNVDRLGFDNWSEFEALYPEGKAVEELPYPRAKAQRQVPVYIRVALADRAQIIGAADSAVA